MPLYVGLDCSTQALKFVAIDASDLRVVAEASVNFDADLPQFGTRGGVIHHADGVTKTSPPQMWLAALDRLLAQLQRARFAFADVVSVSGSGQQHGSVYFATGARQRLQTLDPQRTLLEHLGDERTFSVAQSPLWMDSSTTAQCAYVERAVGGSQQLATVTGSRAYERFTGQQIRKLYEQQPSVYERTERIALVSSFLASVLCGDYAHIDVSDGSGMNLLDIRSHRWSDVVLPHIAPALAERLDTPIASHTLAAPEVRNGCIAPYFVQRYGFSPNTLIVAWSGDNPCSVAGMRLREGEMAVSLGTSDTVFAILRNPQPSAAEGHVFCNPVDPESYMAILVYKNGSLTREAVRNEFAAGSWERFGEALATTVPGNDGHVAFHFIEKEITPQGAHGVFRFGPHSDEPLAAADARFPSAAVEVRALLEAQFISMRLHAERIGLPRVTSVLATGGASKNPAITQVLADVFGVPVATAETANSAALGAAYRARHGHACVQAGAFVSFERALAALPPHHVVAETRADAHAVYTTQLLPRYARLEAVVLGRYSA